ncbi:MAG TPA: hypothetical protein VIJ75_15035 [Hanamia sp.]
MRNIFRFFILGLFVSLINSGCKKESLFMNTATIVGSDSRVGVCTGGTFIKIDGHPNPNDPENGYFDIGNINSSLRMDTFPIKVEIDWKISSKCFGNYVDISRIKRLP